MSLTEINLIDELFPLAGQDQPSQGYRDNFDNIKIALTDLDAFTTAIIIDNLGDVDTTSVAPILGESLVFDGINWVPGNVLSGITIDDMGDVDTSGALTGNILIYNAISGNWEAQADAGSGINNVVEDIAPQLGGNIDNNGFGISDGSALIVDFAEALTPINWLTLGNSDAAEPVTIQASGSNTNIGISLTSKGNGEIIIDSTGSNAAMTTIDGKVLNINSSSSIRIESADNSAGTASNIFLVGGDSTGSNGDGGSIYITPGALNGTGFNGSVSIRDASSSNIVRFAGGSGTTVNYFGMYSTSTGVNPTILALGDDANVGITLTPKGTGSLELAGWTLPSFTVSSPVTDGSMVSVDSSGNMSFVSPSTDLGEYTLVGLPDPTLNANAYALVTDAIGGRTIVRSNGTNWKIVAVEGATVS